MDYGRGEKNVFTLTQGQLASYGAIITIAAGIVAFLASRASSDTNTRDRLDAIEHRQNQYEIDKEKMSDQMSDVLQKVSGMKAILDRWDREVRSGQNNPVPYYTKPNDSR